MSNYLELEEVKIPEEVMEGYMFMARDKAINYLESVYDEDEPYKLEELAKAFSLIKETIRECVETFKRNNVNEETQRICFFDSMVDSMHILAASMLSVNSLPAHHPNSFYSYKMIEFARFSRAMHLLSEFNYVKEYDSLDQPTYGFNLEFFKSE